MISIFEEAVSGSAEARLRIWRAFKSCVNAKRSKLNVSRNVDVVRTFAAFRPLSYTHLTLPTILLV